MSRKFLRSDWMRYSRIGKKRKKLQKWRRPRGMHNKTRKRRKGYPDSPQVGYRTEKKISGKVKGLVPMLVHNVQEVSKASKHSIIIISSRVGARKKIEIIKKASDMGLKMGNIKGDKK